MCHFLKGTLASEMESDFVLQSAFESLFDVDEGQVELDCLPSTQEENDNFPAFHYTVAMSIIIANYEVVSVSYYIALLLLMITIYLWIG
jgi:hypothetical protein